MSIQFAIKLAASFALASALTLGSFAQQTAPSPDSSAQTQAQDSPKEPAPEPNPNPDPAKSIQTAAPAENAAKDAAKPADESSQKGTSKDRLFFALPNFLTLENAGNVPPLSSGQKFHIVFRSSFDYVQFGWYAFLAGISQAENSEPGYGQGWEGYGKRYGAAMADGTIENFMTSAVLPSMLHQDPRFFQLGTGSFGHRAFYAVTRNLVTRSDSGKSQFNYSEVVGGALAATISTYAYHPAGKYVTTTTPGVLHYIPSDRTISNTAKVWGAQYCYDTLTVVIKEFWPDIRRKMKHTKSEPGISLENPAH